MDNLDGDDPFLPPPLYSLNFQSAQDWQDDQQTSARSLASEQSAQNPSVLPSMSGPMSISNFLEEQDSQSYLNDDFIEHPPSPSAFLFASSYIRPQQLQQRQQQSNNTRSDPSRQPYRSSPPMSYHNQRASPDPNLFVPYDTPPQQPHNQPQTDDFIDLVSSPPRVNNTMPARTRQMQRSSPAAANTATIPVKRRRGSTPKILDMKRPRFGSKEIEEVDLSSVKDDEDYAEFAKRTKEAAAKQRQVDEANKPVKLSEFQCIICLDNPTDLTVTWCGHLFCSQCLHEALHAGTQKKVCPICRQTINTNLVKSKTGTMKPGSRGVFPLSMKLMTAKRKGKQADR